MFSRDAINKFSLISKLYNGAEEQEGRGREEEEEEEGEEEQEQDQVHLEDVEDGR